MESTEPLSPQDQVNAEIKTVFSLLSKIKEPEHQALQKETDDDIAIITKDPVTSQTTINKVAYLKLHQGVSQNRTCVIEKIKENYQKTDEENEFTADTTANRKETLESLKEKYSPSGYNKPQPAPKPRKSKLSKSQIITPSKKDQAKEARLSLNFEKNKHKDVNSNQLHEGEENASEDEIVIVTRSDSEESIDIIQKELSAFTMEKKKRTNSFRKLFSVFSTKDKKKNHEDKHKAANVQNESNSFSRQSSQRHVMEAEAKIRSNGNKIQRSDSDVRAPSQYSQELEKKYAQMHINKFNQFKENFENTQNPKVNYTPMDKPIQKTNESYNTYMNMPNIRKYIDTSSSASTLESDRSNLYHDTSVEQPREESEFESRTYPSNSFRPSRVTDGRRDTPPRLLETKMDVRLVNPKALIPINSERPLPNPYQNGDKASHEAYLIETYGTVFDSLENKQKLARIHDKPPRPPSVEPSKLRLPPNREIVPLSPRIKSPIPSDNVSTEKIIATELLKPKRSPTPTRRVAKQESVDHQKFGTNCNSASRDSLLKSADNLSSRTVPDSYNSCLASQASQSSHESVVLRNRMSQASPITINAQIHTNLPTHRAPTPTQPSSKQNLSLSPVKSANVNIRPTTPLGGHILQSPKTTPQKEDIRKSIEAYYWKEIKKMKDQENYELYLMQMQYGTMIPYGYAEDPVSVRRSRSMSPSATRNSRRSLSLPRDTRPPSNVTSDRYINAIPENRAVTNQVQPRSMQQLQFQQQQQQQQLHQQQQPRQQQYFQRNTPERSTVDGSPRRFEGNSNSLYRPIFKRGSLSIPPRSQPDDTLKRKVSFSGNQDQQLQAWPTKNGFTPSPPQRRIDKHPSQGDDEVFFPSTPRIANDNRYPRPDYPIEEIYYNTRQNVVGPINEPVYVVNTNQNSLYRHQKQEVENPYGQRESIRTQTLPTGLTRHGSIQIQEELYGYHRQPQSRRLSFQHNPIQENQYASRREGSGSIQRHNLVTDAQGYPTKPQYIYAPRQNMPIREDYYNRQPQKQVSVNNKVCDIYGQIHDASSPRVQHSGVIMGQLCQSPGSPVVVRNSYAQLPSDNFVRNSRLTASANDMYRRIPPSYPKESFYGRLENGGGAPNRPLPPVPPRRGTFRHNMASDTESGSEATTEVQKILNSSSQSKKRGIFGK